MLGWLVHSWSPVPLCLFLPLTVELIREQGLGVAPSCSTELREERVGGKQAAKELQASSSLVSLFPLIPSPQHALPVATTAYHLRAP